MIRDASFHELTKVTCSTFTATLLAYKMSFAKTSATMTIEELIARFRKEYKAKQAAGTWSDTTFTKTPQARKSEDKQVVALKAEVHRLKQNRLGQTPFLQGNQESSKRAPDWGKGTDLRLKMTSETGNGYILATLPN